MKYLWIGCVLYLSSTSIQAQQKPTDLDKSPMDVSYCPNNYPILKMSGKTTDAPIARILYSRPQKANRTIFGGIVKYNEVWRLGANEATEIDIYEKVKINGHTLNKGRYSMYCIPSEKKWTLIFNSEKDIWGIAYNSKKDVLKVDVIVEENTESVEVLTIYFDQIKNDYSLNILWDNFKVTLPIHKSK